MNLAFRRFAGLVLIAMCLPFFVHAQTSTGTIVGIVTDKTGAAVPNATVKVSSQLYGNIPRTFTTDSAGGYRVEGLLPGAYTVSISAGGFSDFTVTNVQVKGSLEVTANARLEVSTVSSTITVEASAGQELQTESGSLGAEI